MIALCAWLFAVFDFIIFGTLLPQIFAGFGWDKTTTSLISTLVSVTTAVIALAAEPITDRIGRRKGMILTVSGTAVASTLSSVTPSAAYLIALIRRGLREQGRAAEAAELARSYGVEEHPTAPLAAIFRGEALRNTLVLGAAWFINSAGMQLFSVLGTTVLTLGKHVSFTNSLLLLMVANAVGYLGYVAHGFLGDRLGRRNVIAVGWIISGILFALMLTVAQGVAAWSSSILWACSSWSARTRPCCSTWASAMTRPAAPRAPDSSTPCPSPARSWPGQLSRRCRERLDVGTRHASGRRRRNLHLGVRRVRCPQGSGAAGLSGNVDVR